MTGCTPCDLGLDHCHAPILEHADGTFECVEGCGGPRAIHDDVLLADDVLLRLPVGGSPMGRAA